MSTTETMTIVGAGLAGAKAAEALRERGYAGRLVLIGAEAHLPYERPPLSKAYLNGSAERDSMLVHPAQWYRDQQIELRLGQAVLGVDRSAHRVRLGAGDALPYDRLLLATGASPRRIPVPGADAPGVHILRTIEDSDALRAVLRQSGSEHGASALPTRLVIIGAGWIGLEVAAAAREAGLEVTVLEAAAHPLLGVLGAEAAMVFERLHRDRGVMFRFHSIASAISVDARGRANGVVLATESGSELIPADAVLVAVGAAPNAELAIEAGLDVDNGVLTDAALRSSDPDVFAVGDLANAMHPFYGRRIRVEHWATALDQPAVAAAAMLGDAGACYDRLPYFYTDQYDLGMEYVGHTGPPSAAAYDEVVFRGNPKRSDAGSLEFIAFWLRDRQVLAGMAVNTWDMVDPITALIRSRAVVDPARLADPSAELAIPTA